VREAAPPAIQPPPQPPVIAPAAKKGHSRPLHDDSQILTLTVFPYLEARGLDWARRPLSWTSQPSPVYKNWIGEEKASRTSWIDRCRHGSEGRAKGMADRDG
jgi:hypothetical protein